MNKIRRNMSLGRSISLLGTRTRNNPKNINIYSLIAFIFPHELTSNNCRTERSMTKIGRDRGRI